MTKKLAQQVLDHLLKTNQGFCFLENGMLVSREACLIIINQ